MKNLWMLAALAAVGVFSSVMSAQTADTFEPNNTFASAAQATSPHYSATTWIGDLSNSPTFNDQLNLTTGDVDYFQTVAPTGDVTIYVRQVTGLPATASIGVEIYDGAQTLLCGPASGVAVYKILRTDGTGTSGTPDPYNGIKATATIAAGGTIVLKFFTQTGAVPATSQIDYDWSQESNNGTTLPDASEGNFSNNFFTVQATDATPAGTGSPRTTTLAGRTYTGFDYYKVSLPQSGRISANLSNYATTSGANPLNYDLYWISDTGGFGVISFDGASDTFPPPNYNFTIPAVLNTTEAITTPPLAPGNYYFQVLAWFQSAPSNYAFYLTAGAYDVAFTVTNVADDVYDTSPNNNDTAATAAALAAGVHSNLKLYFSGNLSEEDWYKVTVPNGGNLEVQMTLGQPTTDDLDMELFRPSSGTPGTVADRIDYADIDNTDSGVKSYGVTSKEIMGTWGGVGNLGDTGYAAGDYLIRVKIGNIPTVGTYQLAVFINGAAGATSLPVVDVAPEDTKEPNDDNAEARGSTACRLNAGLNTGLKAMDGDDWYKVQNVAKSKPVEITLVYVAATDVDLDLEVYDLNTGTGALVIVDDGFLNDDTNNETAGLRKIVVTATSGDAYVALGGVAPATGELFIRVSRWASRGVKYSLNVNINNANPLTPLQVNTVTVSPPKTLDASVSGSVTVNVNISNTGATAAVDVTALTIKLTHALGADVTAEYSITGPAPTLPSNIAAGANTTFAFTVTGSPTCTNGTVLVSCIASAGANRIPGDPLDSYTVTGGVAAAPLLAYTIVHAGPGSNLNPGGVLILEIQVNNNQGRATGIFNQPAAFDFLMGATTINSQYTLSGTSNPALPIAVPVGQTRTVRWTYAIAANASLGTVTVNVTGGIPDNPASGTGTVSLGGGLKGGPRGGGSCTSSEDSLPWGVALAALAPLAAIYLRRRRRA